MFLGEQPPGHRFTFHFECWEHNSWPRAYVASAEPRAMPTPLRKAQESVVSRKHHHECSGEGRSAAARGQALWKGLGWVVSVTPKRPRVCQEGHIEKITCVD